MKPIPVILDTDIGSDCDDAGALAVLHALADAGEAEILACIYSSGQNRFGPGCIAAINAWYGRPEIPLGAAAAGDIGDPRNDFLEAIATDTARYGHQIVSREDPRMADMTSAYRRALAGAADGSVRIVTIGHTKGVHDLLFSAPDEISDLPGRELVARKVAVWVPMGGGFPCRDKPGWNFGRMGAAPYTRSVVEGWPAESAIIFSGYEIGLPIVTGRQLQNVPNPESNPIREAYRLWNNGIALSEGRASWDQTAVLHAVRPDAGYWDVCDDGFCSVDDEGATEWCTESSAIDTEQKQHKQQHGYLKEKMKPEDIAHIIEDLMTSRNYS